MTPKQLAQATGGSSLTRSLVCRSCINPHATLHHTCVSCESHVDAFESQMDEVASQGVMVKQLTLRPSLVTAGGAAAGES